LEAPASSIARSAADGSFGSPTGREGHCHALKSSSAMRAVVLDPSTPESFAGFEKATAKVSRCMECHVVTGEFYGFLGPQLPRNADGARLREPGVSR